MPYPNFITEIDGLDIHFIHARSKHENALPLIVTHGWPGSVIEQLKIIEPLTDPTAHGGKASDAFHVVIPSMAGYGFSGKPTTTGLGPDSHRARLGRADEAPRLHALRGAGRRLGRASSRSRWACWRPRNCSASTPTAFRGAARNPEGALPVRHRAVRPLGRGKTCASSGSHSSSPTACPTPNRWRTHPHDAVRDCGFTGRSRRLVPRPRLVELRAHRARLRRAARRPHARRHPRQHHALLADQHGDFVGPPLSGEQAALLRARGRRRSPLP